MNLDPLTKLDRFYAPMQERSRKTLQRVLDAFVHLLAEKPFEEITMAELAHRSRIAVTSIYARFENKQALVLAAHERHREEVIHEIDMLLDPARSEGASLETVVREIMPRIIADRLPRLPLLRAALLVNDREIYERAAQIMRHVSQRMAILLSPRLEWIPPAERERLIDFALRAVGAVMQQRLVFGDIEPARFGLTDTELSDRLSDLFLAALTASKKKSGRKIPSTRSYKSRRQRKS